MTLFSVSFFLCFADMEQLTKISAATTINKLFLNFLI